jgi:hypothetical protein
MPTPAKQPKAMAKISAPMDVVFLDNNIFSRLPADSIIADRYAK